MTLDVKGNKRAFLRNNIRSSRSHHWGDVGSLGKTILRARAVLKEGYTVVLAMIFLDSILIRLFPHLSSVPTSNLCDRRGSYS